MWNATTENLGAKSPDVLVVTDDDGRKIYVVNPSEILDNRPYARSGKKVFHVLYFGQISPRLVGVFADHLEDALEESAGFVADHWPGLLYDDKDLKGFFDDCRKDLGDDASEEAVMECAESDLTYTESGYIGSDEWGIWCEGYEGPPCDRELTDAILVYAAEDAFEQAGNLQDIDSLVENLRDKAVWKDVEDLVTVFGPENSDVKSLKRPFDGDLELISWDTEDENPYKREYLFWSPTKKRTQILNHGDIFSED